MNSRQRGRIELEEKILGLIHDGFTEEEILKMVPECNRERFESIRHRNDLRKQKPNECHFPTISDVCFEEKKEVKGVPYVYQGKKYIDITGDIVDCGIAYK